MEKEISTTAKLYYNSGNDAADKGNYEEAVKNYSEAIRLAPNYANAYFNRGDAFDEIGEYDKAIADYSEVIRIEQSADAYLNRGVVFNKKGEDDRAITDLTEAIRIDANCVNAYRLRGEIYESKGEMERAIADAEMVLKFNNPEAYNHLQNTKKEAVEKNMSETGKINGGKYEGEIIDDEQHGYSVSRIIKPDKLDDKQEPEYTIEGVFTQGIVRQWWIKHYTNGESKMIRASDENFDIPQSDLPLSIKARLFLGFIKMFIEKRSEFESQMSELVKEGQELQAEWHSLESKIDTLSVSNFKSSAEKWRSLMDKHTSRFDMFNKKIELFGNLLSQPIEKKAEAYYNWLVEKLNAAKSAEEYTALANKFSDISEYKNCAAHAEKCKGRAITLAITKLDKEYKPRFDNIDRKMQMPRKPFLYSLFTSLQKNYDKKVQLYEQELPELNKQKSALRSEYDKKKEEVIKNYQSQ